METFRYREVGGRKGDPQMSNDFSNCSRIVSHLITKNEDGLTTKSISAHSNTFECSPHDSIEGIRHD